MTSPRGLGDAASGPPSAEGVRLTVLAVIGDEPTRALLPRVLTNERLIIAHDFVRGLSFAEAESPDIVFVDLTIGNGAGLAMVHHLKAIAPETTIFAMATKSSLEAGAHAVALGGAGLIMLPAGGDEVLSAVSSVKLRRAEKALRTELLRERERLRSLAGIKDPTTSAYSLSFYADVAARELYKASRYGRRLAAMMVLLDQRRLEGSSSKQRSLLTAHLADCMINVATDPMLVGRVDGDELHVLMPETDGIGAHAYRRRLLVEIGAGSGAPGMLDPRSVLVGATTFPHDGQDLRTLMRAARRRAEASAMSVLHSLTPEQKSIEDLLDLLERAAAARTAESDPTAPVRIEMPIEEAAALASTAVSSALRGGATLVVVTYRTQPNLFRAVRAAMGNGGPGITLRVLDVRSSPGGAEIEALCVFAEHGSYALLGRSKGNVLRGAHTADPLVADILAIRLGRATGASLFG